MRSIWGFWLNLFKSSNSPKLTVIFLVMVKYDKINSTEICNSANLRSPGGHFWKFPQYFYMNSNIPLKVLRSLTTRWAVITKLFHVAICPVFSLQWFCHLTFTYFLIYECCAVQSYHKISLILYFHYHWLFKGLGRKKRVNNIRAS